ncbi:MAG: hypothetical protein ABI778_03635 [Ignavibacteriota bacterium]
MKKLLPLLAALVIVCTLFCNPTLSQVSGDATLNSKNRFSISSQGFIPNRGQFADQAGRLMPEVKYFFDSKGMKCYLTLTGINFVFNKILVGKDSTSELYVRRHLGNRDTLLLERLDLKFVGANKNPRIEAQNPSEGYANYYLAHCKLTGIHGYRKVIYHSLYPKIDFVIYSVDGGTKYDFIVHPGGDPKAIRMEFAGADSAKCFPGGELKVYTPLGILEEDAPYTYQQFESEIAVTSKFVLSGNSLSFEIGKYRRDHDLVIDPTQRVWGTYFGGSLTDIGQSPVVDKSNNIYFCGVTLSTSLIATAGAYQTARSGLLHDCCLAKFSSSGQLLWATYYGGTADEFCGGMAIDSIGAPILYGTTFSSSGIATSGADRTTLSGLSDNFIAKFDGAGAIQWATYFGGDNGEAVGGNRSIACDRGGHIYITGSTFSHTGLTTPGAYDTILIGTSVDCFIAKFQSSGNLQWASLYGGPAADAGWAIATDAPGNVYFGGNTSSTTSVATFSGFQPAYGGGQSDGFIVKFNSVGAFNWGSYCGGTAADNLSGLCIDAAGNIYGCGYTMSTTGIATPGAYQSVSGSAANGNNDAFIFKLNILGKRQWATYFGGVDADEAEDITVNSDKLIVVGETESRTAIATADAYQTTLTAFTPPPPFPPVYHSGAFLAKFDFAGGRIWSSYYGGEFTDYGYGCAIDRDNNLILVGETQSTTAIASAGAFQTIGGGIPTNLNNLDAYVVKLCDMNLPVLSGRSDTICVDGTDTLTLNQSFPHIDWYDGQTHLTALTDSTTYILKGLQSPGKHSVYVFVSSGTNCDAYSDTINYYVDTVMIVDAGKDTAVCPGVSVTFSSTVRAGIKPFKYLWSPAGGLNDPTKPNPIASPVSTTTYYLTVTDKVGCTGSDSVRFTVNTPPQLNPKTEDTICAGASIVIGEAASGAKPPYTYSWLPRLGLSVDNIATPVASPKVTTTYTVVVTDANGCQTQKKVTVTVIALPIPLISGPDALCVNSTGFYRNIGIGKGTYTWMLSGGGTLTTLLHPDSVSILWTGSGTWDLTLTVTNAEGCSADTTFAITVGTTLSPAIMPSGNVSFCTGDSIVLQASKGYQNYLWSDGSTADSLVIKKAGSYSVTVTSNGGCTGTSPATVITENPSPIFTVTADGPTRLCSGGSVNLSATPGFDTYQWSSGETTASISVTTAGSYSVVVTNTFGCSRSSTPITVTIDANLTPILTADGPLNFCQGDSVTLDAGSGYSFYEWSKDGIVIPASQKQTLQIGQSGSYIVAVKSGNCSGVSLASVVTVFPNPAIPVITLAGTLLNSTAALGYQWLLNGQPLLGQTNQTYTPTLDGNYSVRITDANGCTSISVPFAIGVNATATVRVGAVAHSDPGSKIEVPIELIISQNLIASGANHYVGVLRYNGTMIIPTGSSGGLVTASNALSASSDRQISFSGQSASLSSGTLQKILFDAALGNDSCTALLIDTFYWTDASVAVTTQNGEFCESGICSAGGQIRLLDGSGTLGMGQIRPNPAGTSITLDYDLLEWGRTRLIVSDALGREIRTILDEDQKPGHFQMSVSVTDISSGYYQLMLKTPSQYLSRSFVVQH